MAALLVSANAGVITGPVGNALQSTHDYTFGYGVDDPYTGDSKSQTETKTGDVVHGKFPFSNTCQQFYEKKVSC